MKLLRMQATFGKLDGEILELHEGLNVITAPNEAGKSTWCAFLLAMLYGIDTAQRSSKDTIADKSRYQPWNGKPMAGRLDLEWKGREVTIERHTKGRSPMGDFRAYDTHSGVPIPELTAQNCGQLLTGVTKSVFERSAFVRQAGHAVHFHDALEQRLQELVTTGDERNSFQQTMQQLQQVKNRCRHNKTGLIPETQNQLAEVSDTLAQMDRLQAQSRCIETKLAQQQNLDVQKQGGLCQRSRASLARAEEQLSRSEAECVQAQQRLNKLPPEMLLERWQEQLRGLLEEQAAPVEAPAAPPALQGLTPPEAAAAARRDSEAAQALEHSSAPRLWPRLLPLLLIVLSAVLRENRIAFLLSAGIGVGLSVVLLLIWVWQNTAWRKKQAQLTQLLLVYQAPDAEGVMGQARDYLQRLRAWEECRERGNVQLQTRQQHLLQEIAAQLPVNQIADAPEAIQQARLDYLTWKNAAQRLQAAQSHYDQLKEAVEALPTEAVGIQTQNLAQELAACRGKLEALGDHEKLESQKTVLETRLSELLRHYKAVEIAMAALQQASDTLQERFAPQLRKLTGQYLRALTNGSHDTVLIDRKLQLALQDADDPVSRPDGYYSVGTRDQIYLALRLAIAELLLQGACPYILDDALLCFDDQRLGCALRLLTELARKRQILLFSCQGRETAWLEKEGQ